VPTSRAEDGEAVATRDARHAERARAPTVGIRADIAAMANPARPPRHHTPRRVRVWSRGRVQ